MFFSVFSSSLLCSALLCSAVLFSATLFSALLNSCPLRSARLICSIPIIPDLIFPVAIRFTCTLHSSLLFSSSLLNFIYLSCSFFYLQLFAPATSSSLLFCSIPIILFSSLLSPSSSTLFSSLLFSSLSFFLPLSHLQLYTFPLVQLGIRKT